MDNFVIHYYKPQHKKMVQKKSIFLSKTFWGIIIALGGFLLNKFGISLPTAPAPNADFDTLKAYADAVAAAKGSATSIISIVMAAVGTILGIYGRATAETKIG